MRYFFILIPTVFFGLILNASYKHTSSVKPSEQPLAEVLTELGSETHIKRKPIYTEEQKAIGEDLIKNGFTKKRKGSKVISVYYQCTSCHNLVQEDPVLQNPNPEARLKYTSEKGIPFLQATTFWGIVNRESWYNDDYVKKYGSLVEKARDNIEESIQLCAQECAQGRELKQWEVDAIMAYFWDLELKVADLNLTEEELKKLDGVSSEVDKKEMVDFLKSKYMLASPATFSDAPTDKMQGYAVKERNAVNGKLLYENSCLYCHDANGVTEYELDDSSLSFKKLMKDMGKHTPLSFYQVIRYGTSAQPGYKPYMPHFTLERMSDQQVEDLRAYIEEKAM